MEQIVYITTSKEGGKVLNFIDEEGAMIIKTTLEEVEELMTLPSCNISIQEGIERMIKNSKPISEEEKMRITRENLKKQKL